MTRRAERATSSSSVVTWSATRVSSSRARSRRVRSRSLVRATDDLLDQPGVLQAARDVVGDEQDDRVGRDRPGLHVPARGSARRSSSSSRCRPTMTRDRTRRQQRPAHDRSQGEQGGRTVDDPPDRADRPDRPASRAHDALTTLDQLRGRRSCVARAPTRSLSGTRMAPTAPAPVGRLTISSARSAAAWRVRARRPRPAR